MRTNELISVLAAGAGPAPSGVVARRLVPATVLGGLISILVMAFALGVRPDLSAVGAALWIKLGYAAALAGGGWVA